MREQSDEYATPFPQTSTSIRVLYSGSRLVTIMIVVVVIVMLVLEVAPLPALLAFRVLLTTHAIPSPVIAALAPATLFSLVPMGIPFFGTLAVVMFRVGRASITTSLGVDVFA